MVAAPDLGSGAARRGGSSPFFRTAIKPGQFGWVFCLNKIAKRYLGCIFGLMRVYLDNCCFNRPFDDQSSIRVKLETDAKLYIQSMIKKQKIELAWSYILDFENMANPFFERSFTIEKWKHLSVIDIEETETVLQKADYFVNKGLKAKDALHIACAVETKCGYFLTTDYHISKKMKDDSGIWVGSPINFIDIITEFK